MAEIRSLAARAGGALVLEANTPLYRRAPARDEYGHPLGDFMVLIPRLRERPAHDLADALARLQAVLVSFTEVVFVDLNVPLNLLWVSVHPRPGVILELFAAMKLVLPEARLVGHQRGE